VVCREVGFLMEVRHTLSSCVESLRNSQKEASFKIGVR